MRDHSHSSSSSQHGQAAKPPFPWQMVGIAAAACAGLTVAAYAAGVRPLLDRHRQEAAQREELSERSEAVQRLSNDIAALNSELAAAKVALAKTSLRLQPAALVNQRLEALARLASECGVSLDEMRPGAAADATHYQTVPIRIVGGGRYPACAMFLRKLRRTFGDMGVRTFSAANATPTSQEPVATFQAELVWFTEPPRK